MADNMLNQAFFAPKKGKEVGESGYNYDLAPFINDFSFYDYIDYAERHKRDVDDYGGYVVITNNQYIIGYNSSFGSGTHLSSFARTMQDIKGGGKIYNIDDAMRLTMECFDNFLTAVIVYEQTRETINSDIEYRGYISFDLTNGVSEDQIKVFDQFYEDYNDELTYVTKKFKGKFDVLYSYIDKNGKTKIVKSNNLDSLKECLLTQINNDKKVYDEEIIGKKVLSKGL